MFLRPGPRSSRLETGPVGGVEQFRREDEGHDERRTGHEASDLVEHLPGGFFGQVHADARRCDDRPLVGVEAGVDESGVPVVIASKSTGTNRSPGGMPYPSSINRWRFQAWGPG